MGGLGTHSVSGHDTIDGDPEQKDETPRIREAYHEG